MLTKQTITSCSVTEKFRKVNFQSHDQVCDDRIRHLNHLRSLIMLSTKVNNLLLGKCEFFTRTSMPRLRQNNRERPVVQVGVIHQALADHNNMSRITISRLMIRHRQTDRTNDRPRNGRPRVTSQRKDRYLRLIHLRNSMVMVEDTSRRTPGLANVRISGQTIHRRLREFRLRARRPVVAPILKKRHRIAKIAWGRGHLATHPF